MANPKPSGVYICRGCDLANRLDTAQLEKVALREGKAAFAKPHEFLCGTEGIQMIRDDLESGTATQIVIAACSPRAKTDAFRFDDFEDVAVSRANLREGVIWVRPNTPEAVETTQEMAEDYVRMACAENKAIAAPTPSNEQGINRHVLVVGGGISGITAAIEAAKTGYQVSLIEKTDRLGGIYRQLYKRFPTRTPYTKAQNTEIDGFIQQLEADSNITLYLNTTIAKTTGAPGRFNIELAIANKENKTICVGSIIQASGFKPYDANKLSEFSYSQSPNIITQLELEILAHQADGDLTTRPSDGKVIEHVVFIQCAGQRSEKDHHLPYCSGHCCNTGIKQATYFLDSQHNTKQRFHTVQTTILYTDLHTPGSAGESFYRAGQKQAIHFIKGIVSEVSREGMVKYHNLILDQALEIQADLVVLATGMEANSGINTEAIMARDAKIAELKASDNELPNHFQETEVTIPVQSILNLDYRQGTDLPQIKIPRLNHHLNYSFTDSNFVCFPYETRRTGIYAAGAVRRPMDSAQAQEDATGAVMKAIQTIENAGLGRAAHPRAGDLSYPSFRKEACTQCKRCAIECPFSAIDEDEQGFPRYNEARCRRCGTCMGACPVRVISFENYSINSIGQQIKAVNIPDELDEKPRILVLACENDAYPALDMAAQNRFEYSAFVRIIPVRCLGSVNAIWITDALNDGYDGVILMGCKKGDDYQCHFVKGSELAHLRMSSIAETLHTLELEQERVAVHEVAITDISRTPKLINEMAETIDDIGLSPFKF